jgi:hypothetical protein
MAKGSVYSLINGKISSILGVFMKTVQISPSVAFANGKRMISTHLCVESIKDDFFGNAVFKYTLYDENMVWAGESSIICNYVEADTSEVTSQGDGVVNCTWDASADGAYQVTAQAIGVEIIAEKGKTAFIEVA